MVFADSGMKYKSEKKILSICFENSEVWLWMFFYLVQNIAAELNIKLIKLKIFYIFWVLSENKFSVIWHP